MVEGSSDRRVYIDAGDWSRYNEEALEWCDIYAKVNIDPDSIPREYASKIVAIGPSFGIRLWRPPSALWHAMTTYLLCWLCMDRYIIERPRLHFGGYWRQFRYRLPEHVYKPDVPSSDYIFFASTLWSESEINNYRALFIEACQSLAGIQFEGGFVRPRSKTRHIPNLEGLEKLIISDKKYPLSEYIRKIKTSAVVYSTPGVHGCLGWHLSEFLALGKAIISLPLTRQMPAPLVHGRHIHYIDGSLGSIKSAVRLICQNREYREKLERGAREYYLAYLQPPRVIERILKAAYAAN